MDFSNDIEKTTRKMRYQSGFVMLKTDVDNVDSVDGKRTCGIKKPLQSSISEVTVTAVIHFPEAGKTTLMTWKKWKKISDPVVHRLF